MDTNFFGYGAYGGTIGLAVGGRDHSRMTEAEKEDLIMRCKDAGSTEEVESILSRIGDDDSWGEISSLVSRLR